jgi:CRISPR type I-D-associated protein Csc3/Cas10d
MTITNHSPINPPYTLVLLYRKFYRADSKYNPSTQSVLKPVITARETVKYASLKDTEELVTAVAGAIEKDMRAGAKVKAVVSWVMKKLGQAVEQGVQAVKAIAVNPQERSIGEPLLNPPKTTWQELRRALKKPIIQH